MAAIKEEFDPLRDEASGGAPAMVTERSTNQSPVVDPPRRSSTIDMVTEKSTNQSPVVDPPRRSSTIDMVTESPVVETSRRSSTNNNRALAVMEASAIEAPHCHIPVARGAVSYTSIASLDLQTFIDLLPLDQLLCYRANVVHSWPAEDLDQILAVANRDISIARRNQTELTRYVDTHAAHLAACVGAFDDSILLMAAETFPRLPGGYRVGPARHAEGLTQT